MDSFTRSLSQRYVSSSPPPNRTGGFHRIRLSPSGRSPGTCPKRPFPFPQPPPYDSRWTACAFAEYLWSGLPKGWGPSPSVLILVCTAFPYSDYSAPSDFPGRHPTFIRLSPSYFHRRWHPSWDLPCSPCRTQTRCCRWRVARCPFHALWLPRLPAGYVRLTCGVPRAFDAPALGHPPPSNRWEVSALSLTSQAR